MTKPVEQRLAELEEQVHGGVDFKSKSGHKIRFHGVALCPTCGRKLGVKSVIQDSWPYQHTDLALSCELCGDKFVFGVPSTPLFGMETIIWDTEPDVVYQLAKKVDAPVCPFHNRKMVITKIWGDKVMVNPDFIRVQWKCPEWFLTRHKAVPRDVPSKHTGEEEQVKSKLEQLGYM